MDRKAISFLALGLLLGIVLASGIFSLASRSSQAATGGDDPGTSAAPSTAKKRVVLKLSHVLDPSHPVHAAMELMAARAKELSGGLVDVQIFPSGQLGSETESIEQVQRGALAMVKTSAAPLEGFIPQMALFGLPYLFRDEEHYWSVLLGPLGKELLASGERVGLRGLCYYDSGSRSFYTIDKPVMTPADLTGKKIRVMRSKTAMDMISQMGGAPTPIPWGELYTALQQGMVDGAENNPPSLYTSRHFEVTKQYSLDEHSRIPDMVLFSKQIWDSLSPEVQGWVEQAADESVTAQREAWKKKTDEALEALKKAGVKIFHPDQKAFAAKVQPMYDALKGTELAELVRRVREVQ
jgi:tripartite ATP-independent transporter DctP family solute receptor